MNQKKLEAFFHSDSLLETYLGKDEFQKLKTNGFNIQINNKQLAIKDEDTESLDEENLNVLQIVPDFKLLLGQPILGNVLRTLPDDSKLFLNDIKESENDYKKLKEINRLIEEKMELLEFSNYQAMLITDLKSQVNNLKSKLENVQKELHEAKVKEKYQKLEKNFFLQKYKESNSRHIEEKYFKIDKINLDKVLPEESKEKSQGTKINAMNSTFKEQPINFQSFLKIEGSRRNIDLNMTPDSIDMTNSRTNDRGETVEMINGYPLHLLKQCDHFTKDGNPNFKYKAVRDLFLEPGTNKNGEKDMRKKENKQRLDQYYKDKYQHL